MLQNQQQMIYSSVVLSLITFHRNIKNNFDSETVVIIVIQDMKLTLKLTPLVRDFGFYFKSLKP